MYISSYDKPNIHILILVLQVAQDMIDSLSETKLTKSICSQVCDNGRSLKHNIRLHKDLIQNCVRILTGLSVSLLLPLYPYFK